MSRSLSDLLASRVVVFDGAMGTELYKRNHFVNVCFEELCVRDPKVVKEVHEANKQAGADVLTTNSFGANRYKLADYLLAERTVEIASAAARLAREVAGDKLLVAGSVGPLGRHASGGALSEAEAVDAFSEAIRALLASGADFILFETFGRAQGTASRRRRRARVERTVHPKHGLRRYRSQSRRRKHRRFFRGLLLRRRSAAHAQLQLFCRTEAGCSISWKTTFPGRRSRFWRCRTQARRSTSTTACST